MKIMGHRGAAGLALENSTAGIKKAIALDVDIIEIDVRKTHDNQLILSHDDNTGKMAGKVLKISTTSLPELQKLVLIDGSKLISLQEALQLVGKKPIMIELKDGGSARILNDTLAKFPATAASVCSFKLGELASVRAINGHLQLYGLERTRPLEIVHLTKIFDLNGIGINYWLLNPVLYWWAKRRKLDLYVFTVNKPWIVWFIKFLYPSVTLCTDYPDKYVSRLKPKKLPK